MTAFTAATITTPQMVVRCKNHESLVEIKISRHDFCAVQLSAMKAHDAVEANAGIIFKVGWHLRQQFVRDFHPGAPAGAFVGGVSAKLAIVWFVAEWTPPGIRFVCWQ